MSESGTPPLGGVAHAPSVSTKNIAATSRYREAQVSTKLAMVSDYALNANVAQIHLKHPET
jgi:hypothetical protein